MKITIEIETDYAPHAIPTRAGILKLMLPEIERFLVGLMNDACSPYLKGWRVIGIRVKD